MKHSRNIIIVLVLLFSTWACHKRGFFDAYHPLDPQGWNKDSVEKFQFEIEDINQAYNVKVNIRNHGDYAFNNLWLFVDVIAPDSTILHDTVEFVLAEPNGRWYGHGIGDLFDARYEYRKNIKFPITGNYSIVLQQGMRDNQLKGIRDVGITIEKY